MPTDEGKQQKETEYKNALKSYLEEEKPDDREKFNKELGDRIKAFIKDGYKLEDIEKLSKDLFDSLPEEVQEKFKEFFEKHLAGIKVLYDDAETKQPPQEEYEERVDSVAVIGEEKEDLSWEEAFKNVKQIQRVEKDADTGIISGKLKSGAEILAVPDKDARYKLALKYKDKPKAEDCAALIAAAQEKGFNAIKLSDNVSAEFAKQMYLAAKKAGIKIIVPEQYKESLKDWEQEAANASKGKGGRKPEDKGDKSDKKGPEAPKEPKEKQELLDDVLALSHEMHAKKYTSIPDAFEKDPKNKGALQKRLDKMVKNAFAAGMTAEDIAEALKEHKEFAPYIKYVAASVAPKKATKKEKAAAETTMENEAEELAGKLTAHLEKLARGEKPEKSKKGEKSDWEALYDEMVKFAEKAGLKTPEEVQKHLLEKYPDNPNVKALAEHVHNPYQKKNVGKTFPKRSFDFGRKVSAEHKTAEEARIEAMKKKQQQKDHTVANYANRGRDA